MSRRNEAKEELFLGSGIAQNRNRSAANSTTRLGPFNGRGPPLLTSVRRAMAPSSWCRIPSNVESSMCDCSSWSTVSWICFSKPWERDWKRKKAAARQRDRRYFFRDRRLHFATTNTDEADSSRGSAFKSAFLFELSMQSNAISRHYRTQESIIGTPEYTNVYGNFEKNRIPDFPFSGSIFTLHFIVPRAICRKHHFAHLSNDPTAVKLFFGAYDLFFQTTPRACSWDANRVEWKLGGNIAAFHSCTSHVASSLIKDKWRIKGQNLLNKFEKRKFGRLFTRTKQLQIEWFWR